MFKCSGQVIYTNHCLYSGTYESYLALHVILRTNLGTRAYESPRVCVSCAAIHARWMMGGMFSILRSMCAREKCLVSRQGGYDTTAVIVFGLREEGGGYITDHMISCLVLNLMCTCRRICWGPTQYYKMSVLCTSNIIYNLYYII